MNMSSTRLIGVHGPNEYHIKGRVALPNWMIFRKSSKRGEGFIFNPKINIADFGNFKQGFLSIYTPLSVEICFLLITHYFQNFGKEFQNLEFSSKISKL